MLVGVIEISGLGGPEGVVLRGFGGEGGWEGGEVLWGMMRMGVGGGVYCF